MKAYRCDMCGEFYGGEPGYVVTQPNKTVAVVRPVPGLQLYPSDSEVSLVHPVMHEFCDGGCLRMWAAPND